MAFVRLVIFPLLVELNHIHVWYFCDVGCTGPAHPIFCLPATIPPHNLNFPQPFVIFIIFYILTSLSQSYPCYCSETCTEPTNSIFVFHVTPGLCHLDFSFSVCKISHKLNFCFIYLYLLKITVKNMFNLYVTLCIFDIRHITIQLFTFVLSNEKKILCIKGKVTNTTTCYRIMLQHYMF